MILTLLIFSLAVRNFFNEKNTVKGKWNNIYDGCDHRYFIKNETISESINSTTNININLKSDIVTSEEIYRITNNFYKLKLLKKLTSPTVSESEKLSEIDIYESNNNNSKYKVDLTAGGLYKDWDTTII